MLCAGNRFFTMISTLRCERLLDAQSVLERVRVWVVCRRKEMPRGWSLHLMPS